MEIKKRKCTDIISSYMDYTDLLESPDTYHQWSILSVLSSCIGRKSWVDMGYFKIYPNMFVVLVGPPGKCRKTVAVNTAIDLVVDMPDVKISADSITREALIKSIKGSEMDEQIDGVEGVYKHASLTIISKELSVFLGRGNDDLLSLLTDLYDAPSRWTYKTKGQGTDDIRGVWLNMLAASTPDWLVGSVSLNAIGGGFTSRVIFVVEEKVRHKTTFPTLTQRHLDTKANIKHDLEIISMHKGPMELSLEARNFLDNWYQKDNTYINDPKFHGYSERKQIHLIKVAMIVAISEGSQNMIEATHLRRALLMITEIEGRMVQAFGAAGRSTVVADIDDILKIIDLAGTITRKELMKATFKDVHPKEFDIIMNSLADMEWIRAETIHGETTYTKEG